MRPLEFSLKFSHVRSMRPVICILLVVCDGSMWEPILITQLLCISMYLSHVFCELVKIAKMSLIANGLNAFHVYTHVLHAICDGMTSTLCQIVFIYLLNCDIYVMYCIEFLFSEEGKWILIEFCSYSYSNVLCDFGITGLLVDVL